MLPKWFDNWNRDNPTNVFGPAILVGILGGAVFVAVMLLAWGQPYATDSLQTGPRGTGMSVAEFENDVQEADPTIAGYLAAGDVTDEDIAAVSDAALANKAPALADLPDEEYARLLVAMRAWTGIPDLMEDPDNYQTTVAYRMIEMTQNINENWDAHVNAVAEVGVNCYTCHRGEVVPSEIWFNVTPVNSRVEGWAALQNRVTPLSQSTSLPSHAIEVYLTDPDSLVNVHDLESRVEGVPNDIDVASIQTTEMTYSLMNYFSNSLGVNCVFCHNSRAFYDPVQYTPQWAIAQLGRQMVIELNTEYLIPLGDTYPAERLGPQGDAPKAACKTCHKGYQRPMQGLNVIADWPALAEIAVTD